MLYKFFEKQASTSGGGFVNEPNYQLAHELHKAIIRKFKKKKIIFIIERQYLGSRFT